MGTYTQLTYQQRYHIYTFMKAGFCQSEIAREIGVHKSTVSREVRRNQGKRGYRPKQAQQLATNRRDKVQPRITDRDWRMIEELICTSIVINAAEEHFGNTSDAVKSAENAMEAMRNAVKYPTGRGLMPVRSQWKIEAGWETGKQIRS